MMPPKIMKLFVTTIRFYDSHGNKRIFEQVHTSQTRKSSMFIVWKRIKPIQLYSPSCVIKDCSTTPLKLITQDSGIPQEKIVDVQLTSV